MLRGSCLCRGVQFEVSARPDGIRLCHCSLCRKTSGAAATACFVVDSTDFRWVKGEELVQIWQSEKRYGSSFCRTCGSPLPDPNLARTLYGIPVGLLDDDPGCGVVRHIYVGSKAGWDEIGGTAPRYDEMDPI